MVVVEGDEDAAEETMEGLQAASGFVRRELVERLHLRRAPELIFIQDRSQEYKSRIDELLGRIEKEISLSPRSSSVDVMLREVLEHIERRQRFVLTSHARPDGDAIGSALACCEILRRHRQRCRRRAPRPRPSHLPASALCRPRAAG